jgi:hypothetical protein
VRAALGSALAAGAALLLAAPASAQVEPVELSVEANPSLLASKQLFTVRVGVAAEAGALDIAAQPLRLRVKLEPECGGSFAGTEGPTVIDQQLPAPQSGAAYSTALSARARVAAFGPQTVCAFLEDAQERQLATSTEEAVVVSRPCTIATRRLARLRKARRHVHGRERRRHLSKRIRKARHRKAIACGAGGG